MASSEAVWAAFDEFVVAFHHNPTARMWESRGDKAEASHRQWMRVMQQVSDDRLEQMVNGWIDTGNEHPPRTAGQLLEAGKLTQTGKTEEQLGKGCLKCSGRGFVDAIFRLRGARGEAFSGPMATQAVRCGCNQMTQVGKHPWRTAREMSAAFERAGGVRGVDWEIANLAKLSPYRDSYRRLEKRWSAQWEPGGALCTPLTESRLQHMRNDRKSTPRED